jgi:hypothetical protein
MIMWLVGKWQARQRQVDLETLWPVCKKHASDPVHARMAFFLHACQDPAWRSLGEGEILSRIEALTCDRETPIKWKTGPTSGKRPNEETEVKLDEFHWHEAVDRTAVVANMVEDVLLNHPAIKQTPKLYELAQTAEALLWELYQTAAQEDLVKDK